jgi:hypothetical protein
MSLDSLGSTRPARRVASSLRAVSPFLVASEAAMLKAPQALAVWPFFSRQSPRFKSVPAPGSSFWLASSLAQAWSYLPSDRSRRPSLKSASAAARSAALGSAKRGAAKSRMAAATPEEKRQLDERATRGRLLLYSVP